MSLSSKTVTYLGGDQTFAINFELGYISREDIYVRVNDAIDGEGNPSFANFEFVDDDNIRVTDALETGDVVQIRRIVSKTELQVDFEDGADVTQRNLNAQALQSLMIYQELLDGFVGFGSPSDAADLAEQYAAAAAQSASSAAADRAAVAADLLLTDADQQATAADRVQTGLDASAAAASAAAAAQSASDASDDAAATAADVVATNADVVLTNADAVATAADVVSAEAAKTAAETARDEAETARDEAQNATSFELVDDTMPVLGGDLDANDQAINDVAALGVGLTAPTAHALGDIMSVNGMNVYGVGANGGYLGFNSYHDGADFRYQFASASGLISFTNVGGFSVRTADVGTVGGTISYTNVFNINANNHVGIGTTTVEYPGTDRTRGVLEINGSTDAILGLKKGDAGAAYFYAGTGDTHLVSVDTDLLFGAGGGGVERARFLADGGHLILGKTELNLWNEGIELRQGGELTITRNNGQVMDLNRHQTDGAIMQFRQAATVEGSISVSGTTISYNGAHLSRWSQLPGLDFSDKATRPAILRGTVMTNLDELCEWGEEDNEQLNRTEVSTEMGDRNVAGVFQAWDDDDDTYLNDFYLAMTGDFVIRIAENVTVERGDLLMSAGDGTACPQEGALAEAVQSRTVAKVTSTKVTHVYEDGTYLVPCVLMAC